MHICRPKGKSPTRSKPQGVVYLRWKEFTPDFPADYLHEIFEAGQIQFAGLFTVIDENQIRQRKIVG